MRHTFLERSTPLLLCAALVPALAWGQQTSGGFSLTRIVDGGEGVARNCLQQGYFTGAGLRLAVPVITKGMTAQIAGRGYWVSQGSECVDGFPPPDGTYVQEDRVNLLSQSFVTTDVRLALRLGESPASLAAGVGGAWHEGTDLPYVVFAAGFSVLERPDVRLGLEGEFQMLRVSGDRFRRTYQDFELVAEEALGRVHQWSHGVIIGVHLDLPL